ncbi:MAG TPA: PH domain-containing protein [Beutenbergiaceae bacterium]|nr:PH domain-containing protein [Beutenbergiaceae bacterium]
MTAPGQTLGTYDDADDIDDTTAYARPDNLEMPWQRLNPRIVLAALLRALVRLVPAALGWLLFNTDNDIARYTVYALAALAVLSPLNQALTYLKVRYRLLGNELQHTTGLLVRKSHRVPVHRIRAVDITAPLSSRLLGLVVLQVGTGGNSYTGDGTVALPGLPRAVALQMRSALLRAAGPEVTSSIDPHLEDGDADIVQHLQWRWIVYSMLGGWLIGGPLTVIGSVFGMVSLVGGEGWVGERLSGFIDRVPWGAWAGATLVLAVVIGAVAGAVVFAEAWWGYRLVRESGDRFQATRGLLTTRSFTADQERLRGVTVSQSPAMRLLRGARITPVMTGVTLQQTMTETAALAPTTTRDVAIRLANTLLGRPVLDDTVGSPWGSLIAHPRAARRRAIARYLIAIAVLAALVGTGVTARWWPAGLLTIPALLVPLGVIAGAGYYRALGHLLQEEYLYLRRGFFSRRTDVLQVRGINGAHVSQSLIQRMLGLASITVTTAAGEQGYTGMDLALPDATALAAALTGERLESGASTST